ncbi:MAG TPA: DUF3348 family protein [Ramlibacter sp.]|nr:DUF3348 family protein [Ramlibacter sp.]
MQQSTFGTSRLVRQLDSWTPVETDGPGADVAERMSRWIDPLAAIRLQGALQALRAAPPAAPPSRAAVTRASKLAQDVQQTRAVLAKAVAQDPLAGLGLAPGEDPGYAPWHQRHLELQRQMAQMVGAVRDHARQTLAALSPRLRQLATLDAILEDLLAAREPVLLSTTASLLERRHHQLRAAHRQVHETTGEPDDPAQWKRPGGWLHTFGAEWRQALLAELDLRLEPVTGLVEALRNETGNLS